MGNATLSSLMPVHPQSLLPDDADELPGEVYEVFATNATPQDGSLVTTRSSIPRSFQTLPGPVLQGRSRVETTPAPDTVGVFDTPVQTTLYLGRDADLMADLQVLLLAPQFDPHGSWLPFL